VKHIFPALVVAAAIAVSVYFYMTYGREPEPITSTALAAGSTTALEVEAATRGDILLTAIAVPVEHAALTMGMSGKVAAVSVREGDPVEAGQLIAHLENADAKVAIERAQARLDAAKAALAKVEAGPVEQEIVMARSAVTIAQANLDKITEETLLATGATPQNAINKTIAEADLQRAQAQLELLEIGPRQEEIDAAEAEVAAAQAELEQEQLNLAATELRAPFAGTISSLSLRVGEQVGSAEVVAYLADLSHWQIESQELDELNVVRVKVGDPAQIVFDAIPNLELAGTVTHITPRGAVEDNEITYLVLVEPEAMDPKVRWNMTARLTIFPQE
jgi:HlyD family secretion protein